MSQVLSLFFCSLHVHFHGRLSKHELHSCFPLSGILIPGLAKDLLWTSCWETFTRLQGNCLQSLQCVSSCSSRVSLTSNEIETLLVFFWLHMSNSPEVRAKDNIAWSWSPTFTLRTFPQQRGKMPAFLPIATRGSMQGNCWKEELLQTDSNFKQHQHESYPVPSRLHSILQRDDPQHRCIPPSSETSFSTLAGRQIWSRNQKPPSCCQNPGSLTLWR